jgi:bifunctional oligoribonuclease and PAP phosphatase NrnA
MSGNGAEAKAQVLERLQADTSFVLATHEAPDGDALGSLLAMHGLLSALGKHAEMFVASSDLPLPYEYSFFATEGTIQEPPADIAGRTVIFLDCGNIDRNSADVLRDGRHLVNIDHHHDNTEFGTINYVVPTASCTAEIVWSLMHDLGIAARDLVAEALYVALITDTGRFMYENTGPLAHRMAGELIDAGVDVQGIYRRLYEEMPLPKLQLLARALSSVRSCDSGRLTLASITLADMRATGAEESHHEGIVDHLRAVRGTKVAALVREVESGDAPPRRKVSLRATGEDVDVSAIARTEGGGGHRRAAGFTTDLDVDEIAALLLREIALRLDGERAAAVSS